MASDKTTVDPATPAVGSGEADSLPRGTLFARYRVVRELGRGGMGAVYEAVHTDLEKRVALKLLNGAFATDPAMRERFTREGRAASRIHHPHVVDVTDVGTHDGVPYLVMEFLEGENLAAVIFRQGPLPVARIADTMIPVIAAVSAAHDEGIIHRDLKPDNIFLARSRLGAAIPKVLDFGISKMAASPEQLSLTTTGSFLGTPHYISPEQARRASNVDARSDQYSLGVILYECATGKLPYDAEAIYDLIAMLVVGEFTPPRTLRPDLPAEFEAVILRAMAHKPQNRYASVRALGRALLPFASESVRGQWTPTFENAATSVPPAPSAPTPDGPSLTTKDTLFQQAVASSPAAQHRPPSSTLAHTAHEIDAPRSSSRTARVGASVAASLLALAVVVIGVSALVRREGSNAPPSAPHAAVPAPVASPTPPTAPAAGPTPTLAPVPTAATPTATGTNANSAGSTASRTMHPAARPVRRVRTRRTGSHYEVD